MNVHFPPEVQTKLDRAAAEQGRDAESIVQEALARFPDFDDWFVRQVEEGLSAADRGEFVGHDVIGKLINSRYS